jgi:ABC-type sugar transport system permease subunit
MILAISASIAYLAVAAMFLRYVIRVRGKLLESKIGRRHPEWFADPLWLEVIVCIFWPLQIIGFFIYLFRGKL